MTPSDIGWHMNSDNWLPTAPESDADKAAGEYRKRLKDAHKPDAH